LGPEAFQVPFAGQAGVRLRPSTCRWWKAPGSRNPDPGGCEPRSDHEDVGIPSPAEDGSATKGVGASEVRGLARERGLTRSRRCGVGREAHHHRVGSGTNRSHSRASPRCQRGLCLRLRRCGWSRVLWGWARGMCRGSVDTAEPSSSFPEGSGVVRASRGPGVTRRRWERRFGHGAASTFTRFVARA
jgi:hypothetical protein